jgi:SagB-type dehydrogenase family enzyme
VTVTNDSITKWISPRPVEARTWELFHENSKVGRFDVMPSNTAVARRMAQLKVVFDYERCPVTPLPEPAELSASLGDVVQQRHSAHQLTPGEVGLPELAAMLEAAAGLTHDGIAGPTRPLRTVPSAGALFPIELFVATRSVADLADGIYHHNPLQRELRRVFEAPALDDLARAFVQPGLVSGASVVFCLTAVFDRLTFKYADRGYRFALLEAGHIAHALALSAAALELGSVSLGGFLDRDLDAVLGVDGLSWSSIYVVAVGDDGTVDETDGDDHPH